MGWTLTNRPKGQTSKAFFQRELGLGSLEFVETAMVNGVFYAAVRTTEGEVLALVVLTIRRKGYYNLKYKEVDETMFPLHQCEAPERVLNKLTPTDDKFANEWRDKCRGEALKKVPEELKTHDLCLGAVMRNGWALRYVLINRNDQVPHSSKNRLCRLLAWYPLGEWSSHQTYNAKC